MDCAILPIAVGHCAGFHAALDRVARERRYLVFLAAPPPGEAERFDLVQADAAHPVAHAVRPGAIPVSRRTVMQSCEEQWCTGLFAR